MSQKPTIVHVIDSLGRGGAETLLVDLLPELEKHYDIVLVTLKPYSDFDASDVKCRFRYVLYYDYNVKLPLAVYRLNKIIKKHKPVLVRSQLYWSTIITRLACPKNIPFVFSVHVTQSNEAFKRSPKGMLLTWMENRTYKSRHSLIGVTQEVIDDYANTVGIRGKKFVLYNYVNDKYFNNSIDYKSSLTAKMSMVAVGNLKKVKNYQILLKALRIVNDPDVTCDIYGDGPDGPMLQQEIARNNLPVKLKGKSSKVHEILRIHDVFIMCSIYEGFGISVAEAMATGLPLFLSDLKSLRETSQGNAIFFNPEDEKDLADKIIAFKNGKYDAKAMSEKGKQISKEKYSKEMYVSKLLRIYDECIHPDGNHALENKGL